MPSHVRPTPITDALYEYVLQIGLREPDLLRRLREETAKLPLGEWQTAPEQGPLLDLFVKLIPAKSILEVGTFTGYGTLWLAGALPAGGSIITCDVSEEYTAIAQKYWQEAGVSDRIDLRLAPALDTLRALSKELKVFDFVFIDADKDNYVAYYEESLKLVRTGGLIAIDNTLWDGRPIDKTNSEPSTVAIRKLNQLIASDERVDLCFLPYADGLTVCRKR